MGCLIDRLPSQAARAVGDLAIRAASVPNPAYFAARLVRNKDAMTLYAACLCGLLAVVMVLHWGRYVSRSWSKSSVLVRPVTAATRLIRKQLLRHMPQFTSIGEFLVVLVWLALNAIFTVYNHGGPMTSSGVANRTGWLASANMAIVVFLAMKNTPLAILTPYSYERLNSLHRVAGYTTFAHTAVHGIAYSQYFLATGRPETFSEQHIIAAIVLGFAVLFTVLAAVFLKRAKYELFYIAHVILFIVIAVTFALHQPSKESILTMALVTVGFWFYDRIIRACRLVYNSINNEATVEPLPNGGTRVVLKKPLFGARAGKHCYLYLPKIRSFQTHPFTIVANNPLELVVTSRDGFTKKLHEFAVANPGATIKASVEGPYGTLPDPVKYDRVILVAGGSGATFSHGLAQDALNRMKSDSTQQVDLIWAVRDQDQVLWFTKHLNNMLTHERRKQLNLRVHVTKAETPTTLNIGQSINGISPSSSGSMSETDDEKPSVTSSSASSASGGSIRMMDERKLDPELADNNKNAIRYSLSRMSSGDFSMPPTEAVSPSTTLEATPPVTAPSKLDIPSPPSSSCSFAPTVSLPLLPGRPDIADYIKTAVSSMGTDGGRVMIAACGPPAMLKQVRNVGAECVALGGAAPSVELHCEQFGW